MVQNLLRISLVAIIIGIVYLSLTPSTSVSVGNDKVGHFIAYSSLMFNLGLLTLTTRKQLVFAVIGALAFGALMEFGQSFVPGRTVSGYDMVANTIGVFIGLVLALSIGPRILRILNFSKRK